MAATPPDCQPPPSRGETWCTRAPLGSWGPWYSGTGPRWYSGTLALARASDFRRDTGRDLADAVAGRELESNGPPGPEGQAVRVAAWEWFCPRVSDDGRGR